MKNRKLTYFGVSMLVWGIILTVFWCVQVYVREQQEIQNMQMAYQILGELEQGADHLQIAADILKGNQNQSAREAGMNSLKQYGYDENYESVYTARASASRIWLALMYLVLEISFGVLTALTLHFENKDRSREMSRLQRMLEQFCSGQYEVLNENLEEDLCNGIYDRLESLGQKLKWNEQRLIREKEETKVLVTDISHQLKTPVASIQMCYQLLGDEDLAPEERKEFLERLGEQISHLKGLLDALVNISRLETGMIAIRREWAGIFDTVVQAVNQVWMKAEEKGIEIMLSEDREQALEQLMLPHDVQWTKEAIVNILENAIKYSPGHTAIRIRMLKQNHFLRIEISDEGIGIKREEVNRIFRRFYRGTDELVKHTPGSGVGLYLTRKILEEQGGNITVVLPMNQRETAGSTFAVMLSLE